MKRWLLLGWALAAASAFAGDPADTNASGGTMGDLPPKIREQILRAREVPTRDPLLVPFLKSAAFLKMTLSPDGRHLAALSYDDAGPLVAVIDVDSMKMHQVARSSWQPADVYVAHTRQPLSMAWVANDRLAVNFNDGAALIGLDGKRERELFAAWRLQGRDADGHLTDWAVVQREPGKPKGLSRLNIRTGENYSTDIELSGTLVRWVVDRRGDIRVATTSDTAFWSDHTRLTTWYRESNEADWRKVDERSILDDPFTPFQVVERSGHLLVQARNGGDRLAAWEFDPATRAFVRAVAADPHDDIVPLQAVGEDGGALDVATDGLRPAHTWFDPRMARLQATLDASLPDGINVLEAQTGGRMLVFSASDVNPGHWYVFDTAAGKLQDIALRLDDIDPARMQPMRTLRYPSFDGREVPAYLTLPGKPAGPAPTIVLIHGGPQARDRWQWDRDVQVFAAHGYAVFQPQFRGSTGFGKAFEESGYGQWGQAMQDDITAGVHWLVDQKIADPARICIVGASYGGYAALWGLAKTPELYKCGVSTAGVSDIGLMLKADSDTNDSAIGRELVRFKVADPARMKLPFDDVSPLRHADRITAPLLLVHGKLDKRVPISEGRAMLAQMQRLHRDVQWLEFADEGHGVNHLGNLERWYSAMFALFERTIGPGVPPCPPPAPASASR